MERTYEYYREIFKDIQMPFAFVDLDLFDQNIKDVLKRARGKNVRIASKSVRCVSLLKRIFEKNPQFQGIMSYDALEAVFLSQKGFDDLLVAYPTWDEKRVDAVCQEVQKGKKIVLMVDSLEHIEHLNHIGQKNDTVIPLCLDIDMSSNYFGIHFGVWRSSVRTVKEALTLCKKIKDSKFVTLDGVMGYEAQIAGLPDFSPANNFLLNAVIRFLKKRSKKEVRKRRTQIVSAILKEGFELSFVNGGGTGSVEITSEEDLVTEVTVGSGFYSPKLFDYYKNFRHLPAAGYAIEITRIPKKGIYTCHGGGYVASGSAGIDKLPFPYLPTGAKLDPNEGAGEVQTPIRYNGPLKLTYGDPIFMRHAKAGELCERFKELYLISNGKIIDKVPTYRGEGQCFI